MVSFRTKNIVQTITLGEQLRRRRRELKFDPEKIAKKTGISKKYIEALETGSYGKLPGDAYSKNFLKILANLLSLSEEKLLASYLQESRLYQKINRLKNGSAFQNSPSKSRTFLRSLIPRKVRDKPLIITPRFIQGVVVSLIILVCLGYLGLKIQLIISPPTLTVLQPGDNLSVSGQSVAVEGQTEKEVKVMINDQEVLTDDQGRFMETLDLQGGVNLIKITARKKHGREMTVYRNVFAAER